MIVEINKKTALGFVATVATLVIFLFFSLVANTYAQSPGSPSVGKPTPPKGTLTFNINPEFPGPETATTVRVISYSTDLDTANIVWILNGKLTKSGTGEKIFSFKTGGVGIVSNIDVTVSPLSGPVLKKTISIVPSNINFLWEAQTYTHPFYEGKAGYSYGSSVKVTALPEFSQGDVLARSKNLIYKWSINGSVMGDSSGFGKNSITVPGSIIPEPITVAVEIKSSDGNMHAKNELVLTPSWPQVLVYENSPLYGIEYGRAIPNNYLLDNPEITLSAMPYFFSVPNRYDSALSYTWNINNKNLELGNNADVTFKKGDSSGSSQIKINIKDTEKILQYFNNAFTISYK